ncbi:hypothetical protein GEMRC1_004971 [Eukaryota sp. GEM-RC1]
MSSLKKLLPAIAFVTLSAFWGLAFLAIRIAVTEGLEPVSFVFLRVGLAGSIMLIVLAVILISNRKYISSAKLPSHFLGKMFLMALFNNSIPFISVAIASVKVNVGVVSILDSGIPIFGSLFAPILLTNEKLSIHRVLGIGLGFSGVVAVCFHKVVADDLEVVWLPGYFLVVLACASYGWASVFGKRFLQGVPNALAVTCQLSFAALQCLVFAALYESKLSILELYKYPMMMVEQVMNSSTNAIISIFYVAIFASCFAYGLYFYLLKTIGAVRQTLVGYLLPFWGLMAGILVQNEWDGVSFIYKFLEILGTALIIMGVVVVQQEKKRSESQLLINTDSAMDVLLSVDVDQ